MKKTLLTTLTIALALVGANHARGQAAATLVDLGPVAPTPGPNAIAQLGVTSGSTPDGLNYYFDNANPPGQTFTTGSNPGGYMLNSVSILTDGNSGGIPAAGQTYELRIYSLSGTSATWLGTFASQGGFLFADYDWLQWTDLGTNQATVLSPNTQYAYTMRRITGGWERMASTSGDPYPAGQAVLIPTGGGTLVASGTAGYDAAFAAELTPLTSLTLTKPTVTPAPVVAAGTAVTLSVVAGGGSTYAYQWRTDGGSGGTLTNIPGAT
ncbi:MAG TPA: hypothetical protein VNT26_05190, partial [Candidatus Sulfotelmatobacter sp.]|nr:hypothetical protein [Candidatus Sulfotelmatobacter sp.]